MKRDFIEGLRRTPVIKSLLSILLMGGNLLFGNVQRGKSSTIPERVSQVRQALAQKHRSLDLSDLRQAFDSSRAPSGFATTGETAQWLNWGNWANWVNWNNWANWANWANFPH